MVIKRIIKNPIPPIVSSPAPLDSETPELDPFPEVAYEEWPEPLKSAVLSGRIDVASLPSPIFTKNTDNTAPMPYILNPLINLNNYE